jgi:hypothetical protein
VGAEELGRVVDPEARAAEGGARGRLRIELPPAWLTEPCAIEVTAPPRLVCARCDGGGCDGCHRSGAVRAPEAEAARKVRVALPRAASAVALRIAEPFGPEGGIAQLILEIREGRAPSPGVTRCTAEPARPRLAPVWPGVTLVTLAMVAAIVISLLAR